MAAIIPAVTGELGKIWYFLLRAIPVLILMLIPGLNAIGSVLWLLLGFWFLTMEYVDYPMGNHGLSPQAATHPVARTPHQKLVIWRWRNPADDDPGIELCRHARIGNRRQPVLAKVYIP